MRPTSGGRRLMMWTRSRSSSSSREATRPFPTRRRPRSCERGTWRIGPRSSGTIWPLRPIRRRLRIRTPSSLVSTCRRWPGSPWRRSSRSPCSSPPTAPSLPTLARHFLKSRSCRPYPKISRSSLSLRGCRRSWVARGVGAGVKLRRPWASRHELAGTESTLPKESFQRLSDCVQFRGRRPTSRRARRRAAPSLGWPRRTGCPRREERPTPSRPLLLRRTRGRDQLPTRGTCDENSMDDEVLALIALGVDVWVAGSVDAALVVNTEVDHHAPPAAAGPAWATSAPQISAHTACKRAVGNASNTTSYSTCVSRMGSSQPSQGWPTPNPAQYLTGGRSGRTPAANFRSMMFFIGRPTFLFSRTAERHPTRRAGRVSSSPEPLVPVQNGRLGRRRGTARSPAGPERRSLLMGDLGEQCARHVLRGWLPLILTR